MKLFISHSWKNKYYAQKIADEFKAFGMDVWIDAVNLLPGQMIQSSIDSVLKEVDLVILIWTKQALNSDGVAEEIQTCQNLNKIVIPCLFDDTLLDHNPYLNKIKGIGFQDFSNGLNRLKMVIVNYMTGDFNMQNNEGIKEMNEFLGIIETTNHLIHNENIKFSDKEEEKEYWINKIKEIEQKSYAKLKNTETIGNEILQFLGEKMPILESNLDNKERVQSILSEMENHEHAAEPQMEVFINHVKSILSSFKTEKAAETESSGNTTAYQNKDEIYPQREQYYKNEWFGIELKLPKHTLLKQYSNGIEVDIHGYGIAVIGFLYHYHTEASQLQTYLEHYLQKKANKNELIQANPIQQYHNNTVGVEMVYYSESIAVGEFQCGYLLDNDRGFIMQIFTKEEKVTELYQELSSSIYLLPTQAPHYEPDVDSENYLKNKKLYYLKTDSYSGNSFETSKYYKLFENNVFHYHYYSRSYSEITGSIISENNDSGYWGTFIKDGQVHIWFKWHEGGCALHLLQKSQDGTYPIGDVSFYLVDINF